MFKLVQQILNKVGIFKFDRSNVFDANFSIAIGSIAHEGAFGPQSFSTCRTTQFRRNLNCGWDMPHVVNLVSSQSKLKQC